MASHNILVKPLRPKAESSINLSTSLTIADAFEFDDKDASAQPAPESAAPACLRQRPECSSSRIPTA
jgi:hypothetical protein